MTNAATISERARAIITPIPRDPHDRDRLREEWRLKALEWSAAEGRAAELEEGRKILLADMKLNLIEAGEKITKAEDVARTSKQFREYVRKMHDAMREARDLKIEAEYANRLYWDKNLAEASQRAEMRMSRS